MIRLAPLTRAEVLRMGDLYSMAPLAWTDLDTALQAKGWVARWDGTDAAAPSQAAYRRDDGGTVLHDPRSGRVHDCWRLPR